MDVVLKYEIISDRCGDVIIKLFTYTFLMTRDFTISEKTFLTFEIFLKQLQKFLKK